MSMGEIMKMWGKKMFHKPVRLAVWKFPLAGQKFNWPRAIRPPLISNIVITIRTILDSRCLTSFLELLHALKYKVNPNSGCCHGEDILD
jgi:hypothetical protein